MSAADHRSSPETDAPLRDKSISPLPSPGLTTFRPPEEFEAGPSRLSPYLESASASSEDWQDKYFRESSGEGNGNGEALYGIPASPSGDIEQASTAPVIPDSGNDTEEEDEDEDIEGSLVWDDEEEVDLEILEGVGWDREAGAANDRPEPAAPAVIEQPQQNAGEPVAPEANDEQEVNVEDDMDGAMEGMPRIIYALSADVMPDAFAFSNRYPRSNIWGRSECTCLYCCRIRQSELLLLERPL